MKSALSISILLAVLLTGCMVGPDYHRPKTAAPPQWASPLQGGETNSPDLAIQWWKAFGDPELNSLVARAAQSNLTLAVARARVREARAALRVTSSSLGPSLDANGSYQYEHYPANGFPPFPLPSGFQASDSVFQTGFDSAWELDVFGGLRRAVQAARAEVAVQEMARRDLLVSLLAEVARSYVDARAFQQRLFVVEENVAAQQKTVALTQDLYNRGLTSKLDVEQGVSLLATTQAELPTLETGYKKAAYHLAVLLGQPPGALLDELAKPTTAHPLPPIVPVGLPSDLLERRPDIGEAERELAAATARIGEAKADLFPKFSLTGDIGLESISASDWFTPGSRFWSVGPTVQWRIFDSGRIRANIRVQNARQEQALAQYEQTALNAFEEVESALTAYAREQTRRQSLRTAEEAEEQATALANQLYANGLTDFLRVLESERALYETQDAWIESDRVVSTNLIALYKALGGGWQEP